jgi:tyrosyl-tRNA synthetase
MLNRDSVKMRMDSGAGMSFAEFSYPLFQGYDWWMLHQKFGVQLQIGGSDQYGNICAGIEAVKYMTNDTHEVTPALYGITTPLLTTATGEKFGKSAGNAVWLDKDMLSSFDLYQYFMRTADADVERYLKLFTFLPLGDIKLIMLKHFQDPGQRTAQHILAKELVELAHGADAAKLAEQEHQDTFSRGTHSFPIRVLRKILDADPTGLPLGAGEAVEKRRFAEEVISNRKKYMRFKRPFMTAGVNVTKAPTDSDTSITPTTRNDITQKVVAIPKPIVEHRGFPAVFYAAGLVSSISEGRRLVEKGGAYVACARQGPLGIEADLKWERITDLTRDVEQCIVDWEAIVLRAGKSTIQVCRVVEEEQFDSQRLSCPGWEDFKELRGSVGVSTRTRKDNQRDS